MAKRYHEAMSTKSEMKKAGMMMHEDRSAACLLPTTIMEKYYPKNPEYLVHGYMPDLYTGVEKQKATDGSDMKRVLNPKKY